MIMIRQNTAKLLKDLYGIDESITALMFQDGILREQECRNALLIKEYTEKIMPKEKQRIKGKLAEKYCVSVELIEKIIKK